MTYNPDLKKTNEFGKSYFMNNLETNMKMWLDYGLLRTGAWVNITGSVPGAYGGDYQELRMVDEENYTAGTVWETARQDWCWETNINFEDSNEVLQNPVSPAVIKVDGVTTVPDHINYPMGRVVFSSAVASTATVTAQYSYRNIQVYKGNDAPWWHELQYRSQRPDDSHFEQLGKGMWSVGAQHRIQMPCIVVGVVPRANHQGYQLGSNNISIEQDILFHVMTEDRNMRNNLVDLLRNQFDKKIWLFDNSLVAASTGFPLDYQGDIVNSGNHFGALTSSTGYRWRRCHFVRSDVSDVLAPTNRLFEGVVRLTAQVRL